MNKPALRSALIVVGVWILAKLAAFAITVLLIPFSNRLIFSDDSGIVLMWLWQGFPHALVAAFASIALLSIIETKRPLAWVLALAALFLYGESFNAWRILIHRSRTVPRLPDYVGIVAQAIIPVLACLIVGFWWTRHSGARQIAA